MAVDGSNANGEVHVAQAVAGEIHAVDSSTDPEVSRQLQPYGSNHAHVDPVEVADGMLVVADQRLSDACVRNRARAHTRRFHARFEALPGFVDVLSEPGTPAHVGDRLAEVHGDPYFGSQGPQRRVYEVQSFCNEFVHCQVTLYPFHRLV